MPQRFYSSPQHDGTAPLAPAAMLAVDLDKSTDPHGYLPDQGLIDAVNVALTLRQPLLLTGEPGTGKTQLAYSVADQLGLEKPLVFETKSTSVARDLFYTFDNIRRFQAAQSAGTNIDPRAFIEYNALGTAIMLARQGKQSLVLIDEIDKAPRDFPNDILSEIEQLYFRIPELGNERVEADPNLRPIVIITSNSEKSLPDAFLRRCIFYYIPFPDEERLEQIVLSRVPGFTAGPNTALADVIAFFQILRDGSSALDKKPGTAELLNWVVALAQFGIDPGKPLRAQAESVARTLSTLRKQVDDQDRVRDLFDEWSTS